MHCRTKDSFRSILRDDEIIDAGFDRLGRKCDPWHGSEDLDKGALSKVYLRV